MKEWKWICWYREGERERELKKLVEKEGERFWEGEWKRRERESLGGREAVGEGEGEGGDVGVEEGVGKELEEESESIILEWNEGKGEDEEKGRGRDLDQECFKTG